MFSVLRHAYGQYKNKNIPGMSLDSKAEMFSLAELSVAVGLPTYAPKESYNCDLFSHDLGEKRGC